MLLSKKHTTHPHIYTTHICFGNMFIGRYSTAIVYWSTWIVRNVNIFVMGGNWLFLCGCNKWLQTNLQTLYGPTFSIHLNCLFIRTQFNFALPEKLAHWLIDWLLFRILKPEYYISISHYLYTDILIIIFFWSQAEIYYTLHRWKI